MNIYKRNAPPKQRIIADLPVEQVEALDIWGVENGATNRTDALKKMIESATEATSPNIPSVADETTKEGDSR